LPRLAAALPAKVWRPLFNRYAGGEQFGVHVDNAVRVKRGGSERLRSDLSATLFLCEPASYEGGELTVEDTYGAHMVKLEGGAQQVDVVAYLASRGIPVCAHIGLQPQLVHKLGGYKGQGREAAAAERMKADAIALQQAGADIVLMECVPSPLAAEITRSLHVPTIGIGAGPDVDGQILVTYDMLDLTPGRKPKFSRNFMDGAGSISAALAAYVAAVRDGSFPAPEHGFED